MYSGKEGFIMILADILYVEAYSNRKIYTIKYTETIHASGIKRRYFIFCNGVLIVRNIIIRQHKGKWWISNPKEWCQLNNIMILRDSIIYRYGVIHINSQNNPEDANRLIYLFNGFIYDRNYTNIQDCIITIFD